MKKVDIKDMIEIASQAGQFVLKQYKNASLDQTMKKDNSVFTQADMDSHVFICDALQKLYPTIPIISEESVTQYDYDIRKNWDCFFLVDPLDGTKEFIQRNDEFTVNIAFVKNNEPVLGVVHAPAMAVSYYAESNIGAFKITNDGMIRLSSQHQENYPLCAVISRSHHCEKTASYLKELQEAGKSIKIIPSGSALKFGLLAEGIADIYPRFSPTMEWDTAAGHVLMKEVGKEMNRIEDLQPLRYNKPSLENPAFIVQ